MVWDTKYGACGCGAKYEKLNCRERTDHKYLIDAESVCDKLPITAAMLRYMIYWVLWLSLCHVRCLIFKVVCEFVCAYGSLL